MNLTVSNYQLHRQRYVYNNEFYQDPIFDEAFKRLTSL